MLLNKYNLTKHYIYYTIEYNTMSFIVKVQRWTIAYKPI